MRLKHCHERISCTAVVALLTLAPSAAFAQDDGGFSASNVQAVYGWSFQEPGIAEDVQKNVFTFENTTAWSWGSSYLFVDVMRSWSDADANAKEVYGEWFPSMSLRHLAGKGPSTGFVRDVSATLGLNGGVRSTGPAPFVVLPGATVNLNVPGFAFVSLGAYAFIDLGRFQGQPTNCRGTTFQLTPAWSLPFAVGPVGFQFDGFVDFIGSHANCEEMVISQPQLKLDLSRLWNDAGRLFLGVEFAYWHNKYGIAGLEDKVFQPLVVWTF